MSEQQCPRCGRGMQSGIPFPSCAGTIPEGQALAHAMWCENFADDVCARCAREMRLEDLLVAS